MNHQERLILAYEALQHSRAELYAIYERGWHEPVPGTQLAQAAQTLETAAAHLRTLEKVANGAAVRFAPTVQPITAP
jgi:hypothetical protein